MDNIGYIIKNSIRNKLDYVVLSNSRKYHYDEKVLSKRNLEKMVNNNFTVYMSDTNDVNMDCYFVTKIYYSERNLVRINENRTNISTESYTICLDMISNENLKKLYNFILANPTVKFYDQRASRMQMLIEKQDMNELEHEWGKYKYLVMEHSQHAYNELRIAFSLGNCITVKKFYDVIFESLEQISNTGTILNSVQHVWGYFKNCATQQEQDKYNNLLKSINDNNKYLIKDFLLGLAQKYNKKYLLESYYFHR